MDTLICGGIGGGARTALAEIGITLYPGASGDADANVAALLAGQLVYDPDANIAAIIMKADIIAESIPAARTSMAAEEITDIREIKKVLRGSLI